MALLINELPPDLLSPRCSPCLSLYQHTHRRRPENEQDPLRFRNLVKELERSLRRAQHPAALSRRLLEPLEALGADANFWHHTLDGLAIMNAPDVFRVFRLQRPVPDMAIVADSFHVKPLRRLLQTMDRYQVLGLSLHQVRLFQGDRDALDEVDLTPQVPRAMAEALGETVTEPHLTVASYGGVGGASTPMRHGHASRRDELRSDAAKFFRIVDRAVLELYSQPSGLPLILAALPEHHHLFRRVSHNPHLLPNGITVNPEALQTNDLRLLAWRTLEPIYRARLDALVEEFAQSRSKGLGSTDLGEVAEAATAGRVATLLIEANRHVAARWDETKGRLEYHDLADPHIDDLLDDLGESVARRGGQVMVLPPERMPTSTGLAAVFRY